MKNKAQCNLCQERVKIFLNYNYPAYVRPTEDSKEVSILPLKIGFCQSCNHIMQVNPPMKAIKEIYNKFYKTFHSVALSNVGSEQINDFVAFVEKNISGKDLLEIGCSDGYFLNLMQKQGWNVWGCDPSPKTKIAIERFKIPIKKEFFDKKLYSQKFDCIVIRHVLEYVEDLKNFLNEISSSLNLDGYLAIEVPNIVYTLKTGAIGSFIHEHISYFSSQSLEKLLSEMGYSTTSLVEYKNFIYWVGKHDNASVKNSIKHDISIEDLIHKYFKGIERLKKELEVLKDSEVYIYCGGGHTLELLNLAPLKVKAIIDKDESKKGKYLKGFDNIPIYSYDFLETLSDKDTIIISSKAFQDDIIKDLHHYANKGVKILKLYPHCEYI